MMFTYAVEETLEDGSTMLWPIFGPSVFGRLVREHLGVRAPTWISATAYALELMRKSGWTREMRAVCTSIQRED